MLNTNDCITVKNVKEPVNYTRKYFEYSPKDETEKLTKKSDGKALTKEDGTVWEGTTPKNDETSVTDYTDLVQEAVTFLRSEVPDEIKDKDGKVIAETENEKEARVQRASWLALLSYASKGYDSTTRNNLQAKNRPTEIVTGDKAIEKLAKVLVSVGAATNIASAMIMAKAQLEKQASQSQEQAA